ncbi:hypothetical protein DFH06DRAFT_1269108 [Mycena polygramma]|nr:hypothetical protein DFH06DRAFT_1269108 [Mycena polygramma]
MSTYKSFAVVGGGRVGIPIVNALAAQNVSVVLLSRPASASKPVLSGVPVVRVDLTDAAAVAAVFKEHGIDVVLATMTVFAAAAQKAVVQAAKLAAVKLFVPSEYGMPTDGQTEGILGDKNKIAADLKSLGIPSTRIYAAMFIELVPWVVGYSEHGKVIIVGKGEAPVSFTSLAEVAGFVAYILTHLPPPELEDRIFRLEAERACLNDLGEYFKCAVEHVSIITGEHGAAKTMLLGHFDTGAGSTGWDAANKVERSGTEAAGSGNAAWPGHKWRGIKEVLNL